MDSVRLDLPLIDKLAAVLRASGFTPDAIRDALNSQDDVLSRHAEIPVHIRRLDTRTPLHALIQLFVLNVEIPVEHAGAAAGPLGLDGLVSLGLIAADGPVARPLVRIIPHEELVIVSDLRLSPLDDAPAEHVVGVHRPSITLACLTVRAKVRRALDLGTGSGIQAILTAKHADTVVATDVTQRAVDFTVFNARLNGTANIDARIGSWFEPVEGETFELIVSNPPYVISPESRYIYRDSGMRGDSASEQVVRTAPRFLANGGFATVMVSWVADPAATDATAPIRRWVEGTGCDAWLLHHRTDDPLTTASLWNEHLSRDPARFAKVIEEWTAYYRDIGAEGIAYGAIVLRRRDDAPNWVKVDEIPAGRLTAASAHIRRVFKAQDRLRALASDDAFLDFAPTMVTRHRIMQGSHAADGALVVDETAVSLEEGLGFVAQVDRYTAAILPRLDGSKPLRRMLADAARELGISKTEVGPFTAGGAGVVRRMYEAGFLE